MTRTMYTIIGQTQSEVQGRIFDIMDDITGLATFTNPAKCADGKWISIGHTIPSTTSTQTGERT
ncbi:MAG: hypothetical protein JW395_3337 [Nitrospira sp.]|nr:hypothetical protein [Nitrospira sp.]